MALQSIGGSLQVQPGEYLIAMNIHSCSTLETTQRQVDGSVSQLLFKCYLTEVASVGD